MEHSREHPVEHPAASVDLNADLGEEVTDDAGLVAVVSSANVACGYHAGNAALMMAVCALAAEHGVAVGAQVSYHDREHFGRVAQDVSYAVLTGQVAHQVGLLSEIAESEGTRVSYVKPHGALYHRVLDDELQARAVLDGSGRLPVLSQEGGALLRLAAAAGRPTWTEGFPDRAYTPDGRLVPRDQPGAIVRGAARVAERAVAMARAGSVQSLCVHGDHPGAVETAVRVRAELEQAGFEIRPLGG